MDLGKLVNKAGDLLKTEAGKKVAETAVKAATSKATGSKGGFDIASLVSLASDNSDVIGMLGKLGALKKTVEPEDTAAQKVVKSLKSLVTKNIGKVDNSVFATLVTKLLSSDSVKKQIEELSGKGTLAFIKKAIAAFVAQ